jgi:hypothetical protein
MRTADQVWPTPSIGGDRIIEEWRVVDRWWTDAPITVSYREMLRAGVSVVEKSVNGGPWEIWGDG